MNEIIKRQLEVSPEIVQPDGKKAVVQEGRNRQGVRRRREEELGLPKEYTVQDLHHQLAQEDHLRQAAQEGRLRLPPVVEGKKQNRCLMICSRD